MRIKQIAKGLKRLLTQPIVTLPVVSPSAHCLRMQDKSCSYDTVRFCCSNPKAYENCPYERQEAPSQ